MISMLRLYRDPEPDEFFVVFGDCAQGGADKNFVQFLSTKHLDIPLVLSMNGVAAEMTPILKQALEWVYDKTGVKPTVALERNNGGQSAMHDLLLTNLADKYTIYFAKSEDGTDNPDRPGWDTTGGANGTGTRPMMLGEWLTAFNAKLVTVYDKETLEHHQTFIVNKRGRPEAAPNTHDDGVMSCAGAWQLYQTEQPPDETQQIYTTGNFASAWES
jgi:hypothetical protein